MIHKQLKKQLKKQRKKAMSTYGTSYKWGTAFFPKTLKEQTYLLYAFVREADNYVDDSTNSPEKARELLQEMHTKFHQSIIHDKDHGNIMIHDFAALCIIKNIPIEWVDSFFNAMLADTYESYYKTYEELQGYMYGSAEVIGLMMCKLIGYDETKEEEVFRTAKLLGEAMQYTNFLRDIKEDRLSYGRLYMPTDRLQPYDCNHSCIKQFCLEKGINQSRETFMAQQILTTKELYKEANKGIKLLHKQGRFAVHVASRLYEGILDVIRENKYDVFEKDAHTTKRKKLLLFIQALFTYEF